MIESKYTQAVHQRLPATVYKWKINDNLAGGVPDAFYRTLSGSGRPLWVEYKFIKALPAKSTTLIKPALTGQQLLWLQQAEAAGEQTMVIIGVETYKVGRSCGGFWLLPDEWETGVIPAVAIERMRDYAGVADLISDTVRCR